MPTITSGTPTTLLRRDATMKKSIFRAVLWLEIVLQAPRLLRRPQTAWSGADQALPVSRLSRDERQSSTVGMPHHHLEDALVRIH